ncbi:MAG: Clp protease ClpP, partial [Bacteroides sp.]
EHIRSIMNGQADRDGTFFDAAAAVKAGIIPIENILHTSKQICDKVKCELSGIEDISQIQALMNRISGSIPSETENKPFLPETPNLSQIDNPNTMSTEKNNSPEYAAVAASLGMKENFEVKDVMARISTLVSVEAKLKETEKSLTDAQTVIAGKEATISNLQKDLVTATTSLGAYQQKEATEKKNRIETMIEAAINAGKIARETKADWVTMAENNIDLAEKTLASIPAREQISAEIASDPANIQAAASATQTIEQKMAKEVSAVVGEKFEFKKIQ